MRHIESLTKTEPDFCVPGTESQEQKWIGARVPRKIAEVRNEVDPRDYRELAGSGTARKPASPSVSSIGPWAAPVRRSPRLARDRFVDERYCGSTEGPGTCGAGTAIRSHPRTVKPWH